jgi:hypothetical protein
MYQVVVLPNLWESFVAAQRALNDAVVAGVLLVQCDVSDRQDDVTAVKGVVALHKTIRAVLLQVFLRKVKRGRPRRALLRKQSHDSDSKSTALGDSAEVKHTGSSWKTTIAPQFLSHFTCRFTQLSHSCENCQTL